MANTALSWGGGGQMVVAMAMVAIAVICPLLSVHAGLQAAQGGWWEGWPSACPCRRLLHPLLHRCGAQ